MASPSKTPDQFAAPDPVPSRPDDTAQFKGSDFEQGPNTASAQKEPSHQDPSRGAAIAHPPSIDIDPSPIKIASTGPTAKTSLLSTPTHNDPAAPARDSSSIDSSPVEPPARDSNLPTPSPQRSFKQDLPDENNPMTDLIASKDQMSSESSHTTGPSAKNNIPENTPPGKRPNPFSRSSNPFVKVAAKVYTANNGQDFIVAIGTLAPYQGKNVATVLGQVISLQGTKGIVVDGTKTVRFAALQTAAGSHHSGEQTQTTTGGGGDGGGDGGDDGGGDGGGGDGGGGSNPGPPPATSLQSVHLAQVNSAAVENEIFGVGTDEDQALSPSIMTIQGETFHEADVLVLTNSNPSPAGVIPSTRLTGSSQILMKTKSIVLTDGSGIPTSTLALVYPSSTATKTFSLASPGTGGGNTAIPSKITLSSHTIFPGISQHIVGQGGKTVTLKLSSSMIDGEGRLLPSLEIVLESSSTSEQASLPGPGESKSTKVTVANEPTPIIILKELRLAELIMKGFGVGASTTGGGSATTVAGAGRNESDAYVNSTHSTSDSTIDNGEEVVMKGRGGRMEITRWGLGMTTLSIVVGMWTGIGLGRWN